MTNLKTKSHIDCSNGLVDDRRDDDDDDDDNDDDDDA